MRLLACVCRGPQSAALINEQRRACTVDQLNPHERLYHAALQSKAKQGARERDANVGFT